MAPSDLIQSSEDVDANVAAGRPPTPPDLKRDQLVQSLSSLSKHCGYVHISVPEERARRLPAEWWKTGVAFLYALFNLLFTTVVITVVHERVPDKSVSPPLPDKFFDYVDRVPWAFTVTEVNGLILCGLWLIQWLCLEHRWVAGAGPGPWALVLALGPGLDPSPGPGPGPGSWSWTLGSGLGPGPWVLALVLALVLGPGSWPWS